MFFFFFFQAEDGIRDKLVTGVQTCALPISVLLLAAFLGVGLLWLPAPHPLQVCLSVDSGEPRCQGAENSRDYRGGGAAAGGSRTADGRVRCQDEVRAKRGGGDDCPGQGPGAANDGRERAPDGGRSGAD